MSNGVFQDVEELMEWWKNVECKLQIKQFLWLSLGYFGELKAQFLVPS